MNSFQRVIKYCAIAFAVVLAVGIISGIASAVFAVVSVVSGVGHSVRNDNYYNKDDLIDFTQEYTDVRSLEIERATGELYIKTGDTFRVEAENVPEDFKAEVTSNGTLKVYGNGRINFLWFNFGHGRKFNSKVTIYIPENFVAEDAEIECGAGNVRIDALRAEDLTISAGAGNITGNNIVAEDEVKFDGGVGNIELSNVNFNNADIDCGVGNLRIDGILIGDSKVNSGVGEVDMTLQGNVNNYEFDVDTGIGSIRLNGEKLRDDYENNKDAENSFRIDGGIGNIDIDFTENESGF